MRVDIVALCFGSFGSQRRIANRQGGDHRYIPDDISIETISDADLPGDWKADIHPQSTRNFGTEWAAQRRDERNYLINPAHPDFAKINFGDPKPFEFDPRLK